MAISNFWMVTNVDGQSTTNATGPRAADGGFTTVIYQRDAGNITTAVRITGRALSNGALVLEIEGDDRQPIYFSKTER